jgi:hypothetical protein
LVFGHIEQNNLVVDAFDCTKGFEIRLGWRIRGSFSEKISNWLQVSIML